VGVELDQASFERGWENAMGVPAPPFMGEWGRFAGAVGFGDVWNREELTNREKRLVIMTILALGGRDGSLRLHLGAAMRKGELDEDQVEELAVVLTAYAGLPVGTDFMGVVRAVAAELAEDGSDG
jgi:alkylhydroperoxidase/carboxymuconolactone decarboxylase family protein YurZ